MQRPVQRLRVDVDQLKSEGRPAMSKDNEDILKAITQLGAELRTELTTTEARLEARLMARINENQERLIERMRSNEMTMAALTAAMGALTELTRSIAGLVTNMDRRLTDLEKR